MQTSNSIHYSDPKFIRMVGELHDGGASWREIVRRAETYGWKGTQEVLRSRWAEVLKDAYVALYMGDKGRSLEPKQIDALTKSLSPKFTSYLRLEGDFMVSSDWHIPAYHEDMADKLIQIAKKWKLKKHIIVGDFLNMGAFSRHDIRDGRDSFKAEQVLARSILERMFKQFDTVYWLLGNHEVRMLRSLLFQAKLSDIALTILGGLANAKNLVCSDYGYAIVNEEWRLTHPKSYSQMGGTVPVKLANKFEQSVIGAHGHHIGIRVASNKNRVGIDLGGMFDVRKIDYVMQEDSTHPMWNTAFGVLKRSAYSPEGAFYLFTDNRLLTDWNYWLGRKSNANPKPQKR